MDVGELAAWDWDLRTGQVVWSGKHDRLRGHATGEIGPGDEPWLAGVHPEDHAAAQAALAHARDSRESYSHEFRCTRPDGTVQWLAAQGHFFYEGAAPVRMIGVVRDVTQQHAVRELLQEEVRQRTDSLRQLLLRTETLQDEERRHIARELHDGLGQYLSSVGLAVSALAGAVRAPAAREKLQRLQELVRQLDQELDRIVFALRPTALEDNGLADAVAAYVGTWSELCGRPVALQVNALQGQRLPARVEAAVFRVIQEALNNVAKHAQARNVSVCLERLGRELVASVEDNGVGFDAEQVAAVDGSRPSWGLLGMRERIEALGGTFAIESRAGKGASILLRVPLH
jgi:PAS domain S-box-containing protein